MTLGEKINQLEKRITELSQPPVQHEDIELTIRTAKRMAPLNAGPGIS